MINRTISFTYTRSPQGLTAQEVRLSGANIGFLPDKSLQGITTVLEKFRQSNIEIYNRISTLDKFSVSLTPIPGSENCSVQFRSQTLIVYTQFKPETKAQLLSSVKVLPYEFTPRRVIEQDTTYSKESSVPLGFFANVDLLFISDFSAIERAVKSALNVFSSSKKNSIEPSLRIVHSPNPVANDENADFDQNSNEADPVLSDKPALQLRLSESDNEYESSDYESCEEEEPSGSELNSPGLQAIEDGFEIIKPLVPIRVRALTSTEMDKTCLSSLLKAVFSQQIKNDQLFGDYFFEHLIHADEFEHLIHADEIETCTFDQVTNGFKITLREEKQIPLSKLPTGKSAKVLGQLKNALGTTLHINKNLNVRFHMDTESLEFDEGALTLQWDMNIFWTKTRCTAHLISIGSFQSDRLKMVGKLFGVQKTGLIAAQDFVDFIECNRQSSKR